MQVVGGGRGVVKERERRGRGMSASQPKKGSACVEYSLVLLVVMVVLG
jgi:hypothetical protein